MTRTRLLLSLVAAFTLLLGMVAGPVAAQEYPPGEVDVTVSATTVAAGGEVTVSVPPGSFDPGSEVVCTAEGTNFTLTAETTADADGSATCEFDIPEDAQPGAVTVTFEGVLDGQPTVITVENAFRVVPEEAVGAQDRRAGGLAVTGSNALLWGGLAGGLLVLGGGALFVAKRRNRTETGTKVG